MTQPYEKSIGLKTIYLTLVRRFVAIFAIFLPIALASYIITSKVMTKTFQSTTSLSRGGAISQPQYNIMTQTIKKNATTDKVAQALAIKHANGSPITSGEIYSGIGFGAYVANAVTINVTFQSSDQTIVKSVLDQLATTSVEALKELGNDYVNLTVSSPSAEPTKNSKENQYFLIGLVAGAVLALGMPFVYEIVADELYDKDDLTKLGIPAFEIKAVK